MPTKSVRLDEEAENALEVIRKADDASISTAIKRSLIFYRDRLMTDAERRPADFFKKFEPQPEPQSLGPARQAGSLIKEKLADRRQASRDH